MKKTLSLASALLLSGCMAINNVAPVTQEDNIQNVCILDNPKVRYSEVVSVMREGFSRHGISTSVVQSDKACPFILTYTARRSWHFASYLGRFEMHLWKDGIEIASAEYAQRHASLAKWGNTKERIDAMIDQMLAAYPVQKKLKQPK